MKKTGILFICFLTLIGQQLKAQLTGLQEDFSSCTGALPAGWQQYSVTGTDSWKCTSSGVSGNGVYMNGYSAGVNHDNEDWLISPQLDLNTYSLPHLFFQSRTKFSGNAISVWISTNYAGSGNPNNANWTALTITLPAVNSDEWLQSENIDLTPYKAQPLFIAFKYTSTANAAALWRLDEVNIFENAVNITKKFVNTGQCGAGGSSVGGVVQFTMNGLSGTLNLNASVPFQLSKDNNSFSTQLSYGAAASGIPQTVYVRISPAQADKVWRDSLLFTYNGHPVRSKVWCLGTSLPDDRTLRVCNWNMRWFGEPQMCGCDTALAKTNAVTLLKDLHADVYCLQEMVSISQLNYLTTSLGPNYQSAVSTFCSGVTNIADPYYAGCQKLAFIYNTQKVSNMGNYGLLSSTYPADTTAYYCFGSGRFPYLMKARLLLANGLSDTVIFTNLHGKAYDAQEDYNRRLCGAEKMTDSLNALFPGKKIMVIGDYNDFLEGSTVAGNVNSPYKYMLDHGFNGITLPSIYPGQSTYVWSDSYIIDNIACTPDLYSRYADSSFFIFTEAASYIADYGHSSSDHYPCMSYYQFNFPNALPHLEGNERRLPFTVINPSAHDLIVFTEQQYTTVMLSVFDVSGALLYRQNLSLKNGQNAVSMPDFAKGLYLITLDNGEQHGVQKWIIQ